MKNTTNNITSKENDLKKITYIGIVHTGDTTRDFFWFFAKKISSLKHDCVNEELSKELAFYELVKSFEKDSDGDYCDVSIGLNFTYHFNDNSSIDYNEIEKEFYY